MVVLIALASNEDSGESAHSMDVYKVSDQDIEFYCRANQEWQ